MSDKHTPGPWSARKHTDTKGWTISNGGNSIASVRPLPEAEGNARLIGAAPALLEALMETLDALDWRGHGRLPACDKARAAIKSATEPA